MLALLAAPAAAPAQPRLLVFSQTAGFRHDSIADGVALLESIGVEKGIAVDATEDGAAFRDESLADYRAVVFLNTTGDVLTVEQETAFESWMNRGGGWLGIHAAADTEYDWPFYGTLLGGAWFRSHPDIQLARVVVDDGAKASRCCSQWAPEFLFTDEWYNFRELPQAAEILLRLDEASYDAGEGMGEDHPIAWRRLVGAGRAFYTGLGHRRETFANHDFRLHLEGAIGWVARLPTGDCDDDGFVGAEDLRLGVEVALDARALVECADFDVSRDGAVTIEELIQGVSSST